MTQEVEIRSPVAGDGRARGKYPLLRVIAHGGSCVVYESRDPDLDRPVAIKVLREGPADRLHLEATAAARLHHPNIVAVHEVGPDYIVMDFIAGRTFAIAAPGWSMRERVRALETVARAVEHAHSKGVVHRDLKPGNILVEPDGRIVLTDFGIAKLSDGEDLTITGSVMGTPHYMAPEQVQGKGFGPSLDIWALGVLLFEAVTGDRPFDGTTALEIYDRVLRGEPRRLRGPLGAVVAKALDKDPARRYATAAELADDLARYLRDEPVQATVAWSLARKHLPKVGVAFCVLALGVGLYAQHRAALRKAVAGSQPVEAEEIARYRRSERAATEALSRDPGNADRLIARSQARQRIADLERDHGRNPLSEYAAALSDAAAAISADPRSREAYVQRARVLTQRAVYQASYGVDPLADLAAAEADLESVLSEAELRPLRGNLRYHRGIWLEQQRQDGTPFLEAAEADLTPAVDAETFMRRGRVRAALGKYDLADKDFAKALDLAPKNGWAWTRRGEARMATGDLAAAETYLDRAVAVDPLRADTFESRGHVRFARGNLRGAEEDYRRAIERNPALGPVLSARLREIERALR